MGSGTILIVGEGFFTQDMLLAEMLVCVLVISSKNILYFPHYLKVVKTVRHKQWPLLQKGSFLAAFCVYFLKCVMWSKH